ncbi:hypothetical protein BHE74_00006168 [Ensete ventricosum]|nr:hypothetical protein BHE74_00006168 [Ensete ventricosum]
MIRYQSQKCVVSEGRSQRYHINCSPFLLWPFDQRPIVDLFPSLDPWLVQVKAPKVSGSYPNPLSLSLSLNILPTPLSLFFRPCFLLSSLDCNSCVLNLHEQKKRHVQPARPVHEGAAPSAGPRTRLLRAQHEQLRQPHGVRAGARVPPAGVSAEKLQPSSVDEKQRQRRGPEAAHTCRVAETRPLSVSGPWHATATAGGAAEPKRGDREDRRGQALRIRGREGWGGLVVAEEPELCSRKTEEGEVVSLMDHVAKCLWK